MDYKLDDINPTNYHLLHKYWNRAKTQATAHSFAESWYRTNNRNMLKLPSAFCATLATILGSISYGRNDCNTQSVAGLWITSLILVRITALLSSTENVLNWDQKKMHHHESMLQYGDLVGDIEIFMASSYSTYELKNFVRVCHEKIDIYGSSEVALHSSFTNQAKSEMRNGQGRIGSQMFKLRRSSLKIVVEPKVEEPEISSIGET